MYIVILTHNHFNNMENRIGDVLKDQGRKQSWLASRIGVSTPTITRYCANTHQPQWDLMLKIASYLSVKFEDLVLDDQNLLATRSREDIEQAYMAGYHSCCKRDPSYHDTLVYYSELSKGDEDE